MTEKQRILNMTYVSIFGNTFLTLFKLFAGVVGRSGAMVSDAIHSLSDILTTIIAYFGSKIALKDADSSHPYGHERFECLASLILGMILLYTGITIGKNGIIAILQKQYLNRLPPTGLALIASVISILSKEAMFQYTRHEARIIGSSAFMADAWHHRSDALSSIGALVGIGLSMLGFLIMEPIASLCICLFIIKFSFDILRDAVNKLIDTPCDKAYEENLHHMIEVQPGVIHIDLLHTRRFGNKIYIDAQIRVNGSLSLRDAHQIADHIHDIVQQSDPAIKHIMIHLNPDED